MERKYSWKYTMNGDANLVGKELEEIESFGEITPERILGYAERHPESELHKCFEWDDSEASKKYRLHQASTILVSISIDIKEEPRVRQRVYVNVKSSDSGIKTFKNIKDVLKNDDEYKQLVQKAKNDFINCKEKYDSLLNKEDLKDIIFEIYKEV